MYHRMDDPTPDPSFQVHRLPHSPFAHVQGPNGEWYTLHPMRRCAYTFSTDGTQIQRCDEWTEGTESYCFQHHQTRSLQMATRVEAKATATRKVRPPVEYGGLELDLASLDLDV